MQHGLLQLVGGRQKQQFGRGCQREQQWFGWFGRRNIDGGYGDGGCVDADQFLNRIRASLIVITEGTGECRTLGFSQTLKILYTFI